MSQLALLGGPKAAVKPFPQWPEWDEDERKTVLGVLDSGKWWQYAYGTPGSAELGGTDQRERSQIEQFEEEFAAMHRVKHGIATSSGQMALDVCMRAIGLQPGDEVITTPYTFFATSMCILNAYALPVYVDIDPQTYNLDVRKLEAAITERTRAILPVHFGGELCDMDAINAIAKKRGLKVIEDAAHAHGVMLDDGRWAGSISDAGMFSLQQSKCLTSGEGGIILTNSDEFADLAWSIRHYGREKQGLWYEHFRTGFNGRMTEFAGALLRTQLKKLPEQNQRRMRNYDHLARGLAGIEGLELTKRHPQSKLRSHYVIMLRYNAAAWGGLPREAFLKALAAEGVPAIGGYSFTSFENPIFKRLDLSSPDSAFMHKRSRPVDYAACLATCPHAVNACRHEAVWLMQNVLLGDQSHVDAILEAIGKIRANLAGLRRTA